MKTKTIPALIMLLAGFIACLAGIRAHMEAAAFMKMLFIVLLIFYILGCIVKAIIDKNFEEMQKEETTDGAMGEEDDVPLKEEDETADAKEETKER